MEEAAMSLASCKQLKKETDNVLMKVHLHVRSQLIKKINNQICRHMKSLLASRSDHFVIKDLVSVSEYFVREMWNHNEIAEPDLLILYPLLTFKNKDGTRSCKHDV